jgi:hypothetical protein
MLLSLCGGTLYLDHVGERGRLRKFTIWWPSAYPCVMPFSDRLTNPACSLCHLHPRRALVFSVSLSGVVSLGGSHILRNRRKKAPQRIAKRSASIRIRVAGG